MTTALAIGTPILGLGTTLPRDTIAQSEAADLATAFCCVDRRQARLLPSLYRRTGIATRGSVLLEGRNGGGPRQSFFPPVSGPEDRGPSTQARMERFEHEALELACTAAGAALADAKLSSGAITQLVTVSCTGFGAPGFDIGLIRRLGLPASVGRTNIGFMGCHGALNGLRVARAMTGADPGARILLCAVELCTLHFSYGWDPEKIVANALFADGAGALVLGPPAAGEGIGWRVAASGSTIVPDSEDAMSWRITDNGFVMTLSSRVPELILARLRPWLASWLATHGLGLDDVRSWAIHPGGPRILDAVEEALALSTEQMAASRDVLNTCGNMSSPTALFILQRLRAGGAHPPCVALGFGPGLTVEAALLR